MSFHEPLLLREFFFIMASANPGLHKMDNNPMSVQYPWEENAEGLQRWKNVIAIHPMQKWLPSNYSFVHNQKSLTSLVQYSKFFRILMTKTRLVRLI